jgi:hypothetical protein
MLKIKLRKHSQHPKTVVTFRPNCPFKNWLSTIQIPDQKLNGEKQVYIYTYCDPKYRPEIEWFPVFSGWFLDVHYNLIDTRLDKNIINPSMLTE